MKQKWLFLGGVGAAVVYVFAVILGGALRADYSHLKEPISELTAAGAPNKGLLDVLFLVYNLLVAALGVGVWIKAARDARARTSGLVTAAALVIAGACGVLLQLFFPQDPGGAKAAVTTTGTMHIAVAGIDALATMVAAAASALWFRKLPEWKGYSAYSLVTFGVIFVSGGFGAAAATSGFALFGLVERITIGAFIQWLLVVGLRLYRLAGAKDEAVPAGKYAANH